MGDSLWKYSCDLAAGPFSVAMCVYCGDNAAWFDAALASVINQTIKPQELVLVVDGPVPYGIREVVDKYTGICGAEGVEFVLLQLSENQGHGNARRAGLEACTNELVALMDADDVCLPDRFEQELRLFAGRRIDIVGGDIAEFTGPEDNITAYRVVPVSDREIKRCMRKRCPFNQMTVMLRKSAVQEAGGYRDWYCNEDYYLWIRMALNGCSMRNTGTVLVHARAGREMYKRRGGIRYFRSEARLQRYMLEHQMTGMGTYIVNIAKRLMVQVIVPDSVRGWMFQRFARKRRHKAYGEKV